MGAKNKIIAGNYKDCPVVANFGIISIALGPQINKDTVSSYDLITDEIRKSAASGIARGTIGAALLGPMGVIAGVSAKNKGIYTVAIKFNSGENSLIEIDEKAYKTLIKAMF